MEVFRYPKQEQWLELSSRPTFEKQLLDDTVNGILEEVKSQKDKALFQYAEKFDGVKLEALAVIEKEIAEAYDLVSNELKSAINLAESNIKKFHGSQQEEQKVVETVRGVKCWRKSVGIEKVGLYIPGGSAPLFSTILMLGIPAKLAGCKEVVLCTPPDKRGKINPAILYTANLVGITKIFKAGGAQAIAAMAYGTETVPQVYKIFGPGNQFVTKAKELIQQEGVAIDMPAGPSEVLVIADETSNPEFIAADLLSQAEHGADSQVILLSDHQKTIDQSLLALEKQVQQLPRKEVALMAIKNSRAILLNDLNECLSFSNNYAPEHLIIASEKATDFIDKITNAGSVFLGNYSCESAGDYASGTNHTLPTNGYAKNYSGVSIDSFVKKITFQKLTQEGINNIGPAIELMAEAEELLAHKNAVTLRLNISKDSKPEAQNPKFAINRIVRENIKSLKSYSSARDEFTGSEGVFLDANENPFGTLNRYPDPYQAELKEKLSELKDVPTNNIFIGNGSDEVIDLAFRIFCNPGVDKALTFSPTYGMYDVSAGINDVELLKAPLTSNFQIDTAALKNYLNDETIKIIFLCSPNNPTGNSFDIDDIKYVLDNFSGMVIIDEAYIDFSPQESWAQEITKYSNLIVSQTFSKAWGLAAARVGVAYANTEIIDLFNKVKPPYNISGPNQSAALKALSDEALFEKNRKSILIEKERLEKSFGSIECIKKVYPSEANFLLVEVENANVVYEDLVEQKVITRNRNGVVNNCIRISVGKPEENKQLLKALANVEKENK